MVEHPYLSCMPKGMHFFFKIHSLHSPWPSPPAARRHIVRGEALPLNVGLQLASLMICTQQHTIYRPVASTLKYLKWPTLVSKVHISIRIFRYKTYTYQESTLFSEAIISNILLTVIICYISTYRCTLSIHPTPSDTYDIIHNSHRRPQAAPSLLYNLLAAGFWRSGSRHRRGRRWGTPPQGCPMWLCRILQQSTHRPCRPCPQFGAMFRCPLPILRTSTQTTGDGESRRAILKSNLDVILDIMDYVPGCCWGEYSFEGLKTEMSWKERTHCDWEKISDGTMFHRVWFQAHPGTTNPLPSQSLLMFETC